MPHASKRIRSLLLLLVWSIALPAFSGQEAKKADAKPPDFSGEAYVTEESVSRWSFASDGTGTHELLGRIRIQSDAGVQQFGLLRFPYEKATGSLDIDYVRVHKPDGSVITTPPEDVQDMPSEVSREAPFYSDLREKQVPVKGLGVGDVLEFQFRSQQTKPLVPGQFWMAYQFSHDDIVQEEKVEVSVPRERAIKVKSPALAPVVTEEGARRVYTWTRSNLKRKSESKGELAQLAVRGRLPAPDILLSSFQSWDEVGRWYDSLQRDRVAPTAEIREKAAELTRNAPDDAAKLQAIYKYVSTQFRYIGVDFGIGRYQPHAAAEVMSNEYGDCKDKHTLLASLLAAAGIPAYPALINSSRVLDPDVPSPGQFDHVITVVPRGKDMLWLDATTEVAPFGYLATPLRDKPALVVFSGQPPALETTPADLPYPASWTYTIDATLDDSGTLKGKVEESFRGDDEVGLRLALRRLPQTQWKDLVQQISYGTGFAGEVSDVTASMPEATEAPLHLSYTYTRKDYPDWQGRRISPPMPEFFSPAVLALLLQEEGKPLSMLWLGSPGTFEFEARVQLPAGYTPELPKNKDIEEKFIEYHSSYAVQDSRLVARYRVVLKAREVTGAEVAAYKAFTEKVNDERNVYIPLSGASRTPAEAMAKLHRQIWDLPDSSDPKAMELEHQAREAVQRRDLSEAGKDLEQAVAQDPKFTRGWIFLAQVYMGTLQKDASLAAYHKAIDSDPSHGISYKMLAFALASLQRRDEAIQVWLQMAKVAPDDHDIPTNLGNLLVLEKRYREAVPYLETAAKLYPQNSGQQLSLGNACLRVGEDEKALAAFDRAIQLEPGQRNNVAFILADANHHLDVALRYAQEAVHDEEQDSGGVRLQSLTVEDLRHTSALAADWDTLGWVHYRLGDLKQAEDYLSAAWKLAQDPMMGDHLGQVYEKQHRIQEAIHIYRLVFSQASSQAPNPETFEDVQKRLRHLGAAAEPGRHPNFGAELSKQRTIALPRLVRGQTSAEFFVLLAPGAKVEATRFISGSEELRHAGNALAQAHFENTFPKDSNGQLVRRGILGCYPASGCSFVLLLPQSVRSVY